MEILNEESGDCNPKGKCNDRFRNLSCIIGAKWRDLPFTDPKLLAECQELARLDRIRYEQEVRLWKQRKAEEDEEQNEEMDSSETAEENDDSEPSEREVHEAISPARFSSTVSHPGFEFDDSCQFDSTEFSYTGILSREQSHNGQPDQWSEFLHGYMADHDRLVDEMLPIALLPVRHGLDDMSAATSTLTSALYPPPFAAPRDDSDAMHVFGSASPSAFGVERRTQSNHSDSLQLDCTEFSDNGIKPREQSYNEHPDQWSEFLLRSMPDHHRQVDEMLPSEPLPVRYGLGEMSAATAALTQTFHPSPAQHGSDDMRVAAITLTHTFHPPPLAALQAASDATCTVDSTSPSAFTVDRLIRHLGTETSDALVDKINSL
jgi:hypothetical protein